MQQIAQWLERLGMAEYVQRFAENRIDLAVLPDLTDQDLKDIGVALGDRRKLLRAIGELGSVARTEPAAPITTTSQGVAERRQITVMFCDLVGSTALSARLDPEDLREVIGAYHRSCATLVERNGGFVAKYMGDGVLVYFGYPQAHEHDAEHAVQAGLAIIEAVPKLVTPAGEPMHVRVGIATGLVVVGDLIGSGEARERGVVGETPNLAARLQAIAEPGSVVIADSTRKLLGNLFELRDLGLKDLKGIAGPVRAWTALRVSSAESRFEALRANGLIAPVGREEESELLLQRWTKAKTGEGQFVVLSGEAGIGKSRLTAALLEQLASQRHERRRYFCSPQHTDSALYPIINQMERAAGLAREDSPQTKLDKLDSMLAHAATPPQDAALFAELLSLPNDGRYPSADLTPQRHRQRTLEALMAQIEMLTHSSPLLMIFEDAHWSDPTSLELLGLLVDRVAKLRALMIVTFRPEFKPSWAGRAHLTELAINRLTQHDAKVMIDRVVGNRVLPASVREDILERTDGIPLFVEEMTKAVLEAQGEDSARQTTAAIPSLASAVPASLHASLMARLDRLGPAREVAQIGGAIGREFSHALLALVACKPEPELGLALARLVAAGLLIRQGTPLDATYLFNHALVQDAAYGTLLREPRRALHARIAETLENQFAETAEGQPELLARHYGEAGLIEKAASLWAKAGQRSLARSALIEAAEQLTRALGQFATLPATAVLRREKIKLQVGLANALLHTKGHAAPETKASFDQARAFINEAEALGETPEDPLVLFSVLYGFWVVNRMAFQGDVVRELAAQFQALAQNQKTTAPTLIGHVLVGISLVLAGNIADGRAQLDRAIGLYDPTAHKLLATRFGHDLRVSALCWRAVALWALGSPAAALADTAQALKDARESDHAATMMYALSHTSLTLIHCGRYEAASELIDELVGLADQKRTLFWRAYGMLLRGWFFAVIGQASNAVEMLTAGMTAIRSTGATAYAPWYLSNLASAHAELGQFDEAWRCINEALAAADSTQEMWCAADVHRIAGEIALMSLRPDLAKGEAHLKRALSVAREQQAKSFELQAAVSLARLWRDQGKRAEARDLVAPIFGRFTEGFDTLGLKRAKALIEEIA